MFLSLSCANCDAFLMLYQKDGKGALRRCYYNRILYPPDLAVLQSIGAEASSAVLRCGACSSPIGHEMIYRDGRPAFRLVPGSVRTKRGVHVPPLPAVRAD